MKLSPKVEAYVVGLGWNVESIKKGVMLTKGSMRVYIKHTKALGYTLSSDGRFPGKSHKRYFSAQQDLRSYLRKIDRKTEDVSVYLKRKKDVLKATKKMKLSPGQLFCVSCKKVVPESKFCMYCAKSLLFVPPKEFIPMRKELQVSPDDPF